MVNSTAYLAIALISGALIPLQAGMNATLSRFAGHPMWATLVSLIVSLVAVLIVLTALRPMIPTLSGMLQSPWWVWLAGLVGVIFIVAALILAPKLGAATFIAAVVAGQMLAAMLLDHYGLVGFPERSVTWLRIVGTLLVVSGVLTMQMASAASGHTVR